VELGEKIGSGEATRGGLLELGYYGTVQLFTDEVLGISTVSES